MRVSEAITMLNQVLKDYGDIEFVTMDLVEEGFYIEFDKIIDVLGLPNEDGTEEKVAAFVVPFEITDDPEDPTVPKKSGLSFVK